MAIYTINWGSTSTGPTTAADGTDTLFDGTDNYFDIAVSTPSGGGGAGEEWQYEDDSSWNSGNGIDGSTNELVAYGVNDPTVAQIDFTDGAVSDVTFELYDVDAGTWDDSVTIYAVYGTGASAVNVPVVFSNTNGFHTDSTVSGGPYGDGTGYQIDANGNASPYVEGSGASDTVTVTIAGPITSLYIVYDNGESEPTSGVVGIGPVTFTDPTTDCFTAGTMIETERGEVAIEDLQVGDMVRTMDHGMQPLRWVNSSKVKAKGRRAPVLIKKGALGNDRDLLVSQAHRVLLQDWRNEFLFDEGEVLVAANSLVNDQTIMRQEGGMVEYFHILFDRHEIVFANGMPAESFHPGEASVGQMAKQSRAEIYDLFPELEGNEASYGYSVRKTIYAAEASLLAG